MAQAEQETFRTTVEPEPPIGAEEPTAEDSGSAEMASETQTGKEKPWISPTLLNDPRFWSSLRLLYDVQRRILFDRVKVTPEDEKLLLNGYLDTLQFTVDEKRTEARKATAEEWDDVEGRLIKLIGYLSERQIARIQLGQITGTLLLYPIYLLLFSVGSLIGYLSVSDASFKLPLFIVWLATTGGLGSAAFIYVNALSIQVDPTVDVVSTGLVSMRVVLGMLFSVILTLPFGFEAFQRFAKGLSPVAPSAPTDLKDGLMLLLPFILGFSTPLVLSILNRFVQSAQAFFGVQQRPS